MANSRKPGDLIRAFQGKKHKLAPALVASHNPGSMPGFSKPMARPTVKANPNSPQNYGPAMNRAFAATKTFGMPKKRKATSTVAPVSRGRKAQQAYANKFGTMPVLKKRKASKLEMDAAYKGKKRLKKKSR